MLKLLQWLFVGHVHRWKTIDRVNLQGTISGSGQRFYLECEKCGDVCKRDLI